MTEATVCAVQQTGRARRAGGEGRGRGGDRGGGERKRERESKYETKRSGEAQKMTAKINIRRAVAATRHSKRQKASRWDLK